MHEILHTTLRNEKRMMGISCQALGIQTLLTLQLRGGRNDHNFDNFQQNEGHVNKSKCRSAERVRDKIEPS